MRQTHVGLRMGVGHSCHPLSNGLASCLLCSGFLVVFASLPPYVKWVKHIR